MIRGPLPPPFSKTSISLLIGRFWWNLTFLREGGGRGSFIINFYLNYYWWTYENVMFQISSKSGNKWRILLLGGQNSFWGSQGEQSGSISKNRKVLIQNSGLKPQRKCQHSSWIRKCLGIRDFWGAFRPPHRG